MAPSRVDLRVLLLEFALQFFLPVRRQLFQLGLQLGYLRSNAARSLVGFFDFFTDTSLRSASATY